MKGRRESEVQAGIVGYLEMRQDLFFWRVNVGGAQLTGGFYVKFSEPGAADLQGLQAPHGRFFGIECKREIGGKLSEAQIRWGENIKNHGGLYIVARSVEEVQLALGPEQAKVIKIRPPRVIRR